MNGFGDGKGRAVPWEERPLPALLVAPRYLPGRPPFLQAKAVQVYSLADLGFIVLCRWEVDRVVPLHPHLKAVNTWWHMQLEQKVVVQWC